MKIFRMNDYLGRENPTPESYFIEEILTGEHARELGGIFSIMIPKQEGFSHLHRNRESLIICIAGEGVEIADGTEYPIAAGDIIFIPPGVKHALVNRSDEELRIIEFFTHPPLGADIEPVD